MANVIVKINSDASIHYFPGPVIRHGDTVTFKLTGTTATATVTFDSPGCLDVPDPYYLDGSAAATAEQTHTVVATTGKYPFTAEVPGSEQRHLGSESEAKRGELDVTTEPPKEDEKR